MTDDALRLIEPVPIDDDLCAGLALIEDVGVGFRLVYYSRQTCYETGESMNVIKRKLVIPYDELDVANKTVRGFIDERRARAQTFYVVK